MSILQAVRRRWLRARLADPAYGFLFDPWPEDEVVSLDLETTGLDIRRDEIVALAAIRLRGNRILLSERFEAVVRPAVMPPPAAIKVHRLRHQDISTGPGMQDLLPDLLRFIGSRPLLGYYIDFDAGMLDRYVRDRLRTSLPNRRIEVSRLYHDRKYGGAPPGTVLDLRFATILRDLGIPNLGLHDAGTDALMAAMMYLQLRDLQRRGVRLRRGPRSGMGEMPTGA